MIDPPAGLVAVPLMSPGLEGLDDALRLAQTIVGLMSDTVVIVLDLDLRVVLMEGALLARHGYDVQAHVGRDVRDVLPAPQWLVLGEHWIAALAGEACALDWASADDLRDYWLHFAPLRTKSGEIVGAISVAQDITARVRARQQVEDRLAQQAAVSSLGSIALGALPLDELFERATRVLHDALGSDLIAVAQHTADGGFAIRASAGQVAPAAPERASAELRRTVGLVRDSGETLLSHDLRTETHFRAPSLEAAGMRSLVAAPVGWGATAFGALVACSRRPDAFSEDDLGFVESTANILMAAVERGGRSLVRLTRSHRWLSSGSSRSICWRSSPPMAAS